MNKMQMMKWFYWHCHRVLQGAQDLQEIQWDPVEKKKTWVKTHQLCGITKQTLNDSQWCL